MLNVKICNPSMRNASINPAARVEVSHSSIYAARSARTCGYRACGLRIDAPSSETVANFTRPCVTFGLIRLAVEVLRPALTTPMAASGMTLLHDIYVYVVDYPKQKSGVTARGH